MTLIILAGEPQRAHAIATIAGLDLKIAWQVEVKRRVRKRTLNQNARYFAILQIIANETGNDIESLHNAFKLMFLPPLDVMGQIVPKSSASLSTLEFSQYCEKVEAYAGAELAVRV